MAEENVLRSIRLFFFLVRVYAGPFKFWGKKSMVRR